MHFFNGLFLLYTAIIVPVQICVWDYNDPCNKFPTLEFDLLVDTFFLVRPTPRNRSNLPKMQ
jgi:hypothetical protein